MNENPLVGHNDLYFPSEKTGIFRCQFSNDEILKSLVSNNNLYIKRYLNGESNRFGA